MTCEHGHAGGFLRGTGEVGHVLIFAREQARPALDLRHLRAKPGKGLGQFRPDRTAAEDHNAPRDSVQACERVPQCIAGEIA